ncbi:MAG: putative transrane protein, partial [Proteobacteria bacterium]|nr:putative transrane protein [Pseudomonadota bacterium]
TIGQGITGFSTLALGSILTFISIVLASSVTMKVQYYKMVYEADATFFKAFITALVDLRLLPAGLRKLEAV